MAPKSKSRDLDLTNSWDQFDSGNSTEPSLYSSEDSDEPTPLAKPAVRSSYRPNNSTARLSPSASSHVARRRSTRGSVEPELVMPTMSGTGTHPRATRPSYRRTTQTGADKARGGGHGGRNRIDERSDERSNGNSATDQVAGWLGIAVRTLWHATKPFLWFLQCWLRQLFSYAGVLLLLISCTVLAAGLFYTAVGHAMSSSTMAVSSTICNLPLLGLLPFCPETISGVNTPDFDSLVKVQTSFGSVLQAASDEAQLPANLKESEMSVRDLKLIVKFSDIPSRNELVFEIDGFIEGAQQLGMQLTSFNARVGSTMDRIASITRATARVLEGEMDRVASRGSVTRFFADSVPAAFGFHSQSADAIVERQYFEHIEYTDQQLTKLIAQAQALLASLANLDERIDVIGSIAERDKLKVVRERDALLSSMWAFLGAHGSSIKRKNDQKRSLENIMAYRQQAFQYVSNAILQMQRMQHEIQELRTRVVEPEVIGGLRVPLWQHLEYVRMGLERMDEVRRNGRQNAEARLKARISPDETRLIG